MNTIEKAIRILRSGGLVAMPTETVYGLAADAKNPRALQCIFDAKKRPTNHPLIVHIAGIDTINQWVKEISPAAIRLANAFWPGPMTLIFPRADGVLDLVTGGQSTVGIRIPRHPIAQALLKGFGGGLAAPSANQYGRISPTSAADVRDELGDAVDCILDGGSCDVGLESTIIDVSSDTLSILRPGMITKEQIEAVVGHVLSEPIHNAPRVSGSAASHYAPLTPTRIVDSKELSSFLREATDSVAVLLHDMKPIQKDNIKCIRMSSDPAQYAHDLYHTLRQLDQKQHQQIVVEAVPSDSSWDAIRDRLTRATYNETDK